MDWNSGETNNNNDIKIYNNDNNNNNNTGNKNFTRAVLKPCSKRNYYPSFSNEENNKPEANWISRALFFSNTKQLIL